MPISKIGKRTEQYVADYLFKKGPNSKKNRSAFDPPHKG